jgi:hypothetical protein
MRKFAADTSVSVEKSRAQIEKMITQYGAMSTGIFNGPGRAVLAFECSNRRVAFTLPLPLPDDKQFLRDGRNSIRTPARRREVWEQTCRQRWRALYLIIKAKIEAIQSGITTFEDEFLAHIVMPEGGTVGNLVRPAIAAIYDGGRMVPLLPPPK